MTLRTGAAHVEQPRRGPSAAAGRHRPHRAVRQDDGRRRRAERAVARARLRRGHAAVDDRGVRRVRQSWRGAEADADSPRRGPRRPRAVSTAHDVVDARHQRHDRVPDVHDDGRRDQRGHRRARAQPGVHAAGRRQDRHDQRFQRRVVHRLHAEARRPASGSGSISRARFCRTASPPTSRCRSGRSS